MSAMKATFATTRFRRLLNTPIRLFWVRKQDDAQSLPITMDERLEAYVAEVEDYVAAADAEIVALQGQLDVALDTRGHWADELAEAKQLRDLWKP
jgi:hypothetical protein